MKRQLPCKRAKKYDVLSTMYLVLFVLNNFSALANGITVANVSYSQANSTVQFDLTWNNCWRNSSTAANNWDAAWVFVKWRDCTAQPNIQFTHGLVSTNVGDHNFNFAGGVTTFQPTDRYGNAPAIDAQPDHTGVMLRENNVSGADPFAGLVAATI